MPLTSEDYGFKRFEIAPGEVELRWQPESWGAASWAALGRRVSIRCFNHEPSIASSLKFLRRTPWARAQVEALYLDTLPQPGEVDAEARIRVPRSKIDP